MWNNTVTSLKQGKCKIDTLIGDDNDTRRGVTALTYLNKHAPHVSQKISNMLKQLQLIEPDQYYYPQNELHLTILSIISCVSEFKLSHITPQPYIDIFRQCLQNIEPIQIRFTGITASPSCILLQGFPEGEGLESLRDNLRQGFKQSGLRTSIDSRYPLNTAHATVIRFCAPLVDNDEFMAKLQQYRNYDFGTVTLNNFELVFNNWYQNLAETKTLDSYQIKSELFPLQNTQ